MDSISRVPPVCLYTMLGSGCCVHLARVQRVDGSSQRVVLLGGLEAEGLGRGLVRDKKRNIQLEGK